MKFRIIIRKLYHRLRFGKYPAISETSRIHPNVKIFSKANLVVGENSSIAADAVIMNTRAKFILKKNSGSAFGLTVVTGNHMSVVGKWINDVSDSDKDKIDNPAEFDKDVVVEEDVWIASHVTLLYGSHVQRGAIVGAGTVVRSKIPPYAIVVGNPARVIGFRFTPREIIEHELNLYSEEQRLPLELLEKNYQKYFIKRIKDINQFIKI